MMEVGECERRKHKYDEEITRKEITRKTHERCRWGYINILVGASLMFGGFDGQNIAQRGTHT